MEPTTSAYWRASAGISGCIRSFAFGWRALTRLQSSAVIASWTGQQPSQRVMFFSGTFSFHIAPQVPVRDEQNVLCSIFLTICKALEEVTQTSHSAFRAAAVLM